MKDIVVTYGYADDCCDETFEYEVSYSQIIEALKDYVLNEYQDLLGDKEMAKKVRDKIFADFDHESLVEIYDDVCDLEEICHDYFEDEILEQQRAETLEQIEAREYYSDRWC